MTNNNRQKKVLIVLFSISLFLNFALAYYAYTLNNQITVMSDKYAEASDEKSQVELELTSMLEGYNQLQTTNDEINRELSVEKEKIKKLLTQIKYVKSSNKQQIAEYKNELETLRKIMRSYIVQIDSLNTKNQKLIAENKEVKNQYNQVIGEKENLIYEKDSLVSQVQIASTISAKNIEFLALNKRGRKTSKAAKVQKFQVCFMLSENKIATTGVKTLYIRIAKPDGEILITSINNLFVFEGKEIAYSAQRLVEYDGKNTNACIFYTEENENLPNGNYTVDIFVDGKRIGTQNIQID